MNLFHSRLADAADRVLLTRLCSGVEDIKWYYTYREANDFAECVKRMSGKSPCGAANAGLCLMTLGVRSTKQLVMSDYGCSRVYLNGG